MRNEKGYYEKKKMVFILCDCLCGDYLWIFCRLKREDKKFTLISLCVGMVAVVSIVAIFANMHIQSQKAKENKPQEDTKTLYCNICRGKIECEICGDIDALYCEYASYGSGDDHYCQNH